MKIRTTQPKNNKYYIRQVSGGLNGAVAGEPTIKGANVLCNCVGYANGRFNEIIGDPELKGTVKAFKYQLVCNAENFIESAKKQGLKISPKPTLGGIMVWQKGSTLGGGDGAGHVEVVEEIYKDGSVLCSSSGWSAWAFRTLRRNNSNGRWGQAAGYKFRGCIVNPSVSGGAPVETPKLVVDGIGGVATVSRMQEFFGMVQDGVITGQTKGLAKYHTSLTSVKYGSGGSVCIKKMQAWLGVTHDGQWGQKTSKALQKKLGVTQDGYFGPASMKAWQKYLNSHDKPTPPAPPKPTKKYKVIDISYWQSHNKPKIDFKKVKADGVVGVIVRQADGTDKDSYFDEHVKGAKAAGLHVGAYVFSRAKTKAQAEKEAVNLFNACKPYAMDMPLYIDLEAKGLEKTADAVAQAFLAKIKALGGVGGVYASLNWWNNYLTKTAKGSFAMWVAQYNDTMDYEPKSAVGMWQYSSSGKVDGISGNVDMDECYVAYWDQVKPQGYTGTFPTLRLTKTNAEVKKDACTWAKKIAANNDFHYGSNEHAYHNGCFYCGTQHMKKGHGIKMWETTYCCNPFVGAAWAHGGGDSTACKMCHNCNSWGFSKNEGYEKSKLFDKLGHPAKSKLKAGDVLCSDSHVVLYIGNGKIAEAAHRDDNVIGSTSWNSSIAVNDLTDARYKGLPRAYRYNGSVDCDRVLSYGEYSERINDLQKYLIWYGCKLSETGFFNASTLEAVKEFQEKELGKAKADGIVGKETIDAMKKVKK